MKRQSLVVGVLLLVLIGGGAWYMFGRGSNIEGEDLAGVGVQEQTMETEIDEVNSLDHQMAEFRAYTFIQDFVEIAPPESNPEAEERVYAALSGRAKTKISRESLSRDVAVFVGVQDVPDQGVSVEDLQVVDDDNVAVILGLNYSGGRVLKEIRLVVEEDEWKVDSVAEFEGM